MLAAVKMFGGVSILRVIATADVSASAAETQVDPRVARLEAFLASVRVGPARFYKAEVSAG